MSAIFRDARGSLRGKFALARLPLVGSLLRDISESLQPKVDDFGAYGIITACNLLEHAAEAMCWWISEAVAAQTSNVKWGVGLQ